MLLSRVADSLYWMSRYLERAEHTARLIDVRVGLALDRTADEGWDFRRLFESLRIPSVGVLPTTPGQLVDAVVFDPSNRDSVASSITSARENARQVREEISADMWEQVNRLFLRMREMKADGSGHPHYVSRVVVEGTHLFQGITDATMGHGEGWQYLQAGRFLERAGATAALVRSYLRGGAAGPADAGEWVALLRSCSAFEAYCRHYTADFRSERIAEFLLLNPQFPRSVRFASARIEQALKAIAESTSSRGGALSVRLAGRLRASLDFGQVDEILGDDPVAYLEEIEKQCDRIHGALYQGFFAYSIESALSA